MEVIEIISSFVNESSNIVEVEFRMMDDSENEVRLDTIQFECLNNFGYGNFIVDTDFFDVDDDYDLDFLDDDNGYFIDDEDLKEFLNEYYVVYPDKIPDKEHS
jgi:hypothetical protein